jgi:hypothetical protein
MIITMCFLIFKTTRVFQRRLKNHVFREAAQTLQKWVLERKLTSRVEDLAPSMSLGRLATVDLGALQYWGPKEVGETDVKRLEKLDMA